MVQANELRIGNWIDFISTPGEFEKVADINSAGVKCPSVNRVSIEDIQPIPLTHEILEKFGFKKGVYYYTMNEWALSIYKVLPHPDNWLMKFSAPCGEIAKISYLHQLQNLYFSLTGEELKISL